MPVDTILAAARAHDPDRYLSALLTGEPERHDLMTLIAFDAEIARIADRVSEPMLGEIRLQWWRDQLQPLLSSNPGMGRTGHTIADAMLELVSRRGLPGGLVHGLVDARSFDVAREPMADMRGLVTYLGKTEGALCGLSARILGAPEGDALEAAADAAGRALGLTRVLRYLPRDLSHGIRLLPADLLARHGLSAADLPRGSAGEAGGSDTLRPVIRSLAADAVQACEQARRHVRTLPKEALPAFLPLALVPRYLAVLGKPGHHPSRDIAELNPLGRIVRLWLAHLRGLTRG
jgi:phytoene synthase